MRILAISNLYPPFHGGGYGVLCHRLCDCLSQAGHDVTILTSETKGENSHPGGHLVSLPVRRELAMIEGVYQKQFGAGALFTTSRTEKKGSWKF